MDGFGIFGKQDSGAKARYRELFQRPEEPRRIVADPAYKLDPNGRLASAPGGSESEDVDLNSSTQTAGVTFPGMYRGRYLVDMSHAELMALVLQLAEKLADERLERQNLLEQIQDRAEDRRLEG